MQLPLKLPFDLLITKWASILNPLLAIPILGGQQISGIKLVANTPLTINHSLDQLPNGFIVVDNTANTVVWRAQAFNTKTITLESSANTTVSIYIF